MKHAITAEFFDIDQNWQNGETVVWFDVAISDEDYEDYADRYGVAHREGCISLLDSDGCPVAGDSVIGCGGAIYSIILDALAPLAEERMAEV